MITTFNFDDWLDVADPGDAPNIVGLVEAVEQECDFSGFKAERAPNGKLIVSAHRLELNLVLVSKEAEDHAALCRLASSTLRNTSQLVSNLVNQT